MKVSKLIELLKEQNENADVFVCVINGYYGVGDVYTTTPNVVYLTKHDDNDNIVVLDVTGAPK